MYIGGVDPGELMKLTASAPGFIGAMQQFILNGQESAVLSNIYVRQFSATRLLI